MNNKALTYAKSSSSATVVSMLAGIWLDIDKFVATAALLLMVAIAFWVRVFVQYLDGDFDD